MCDNQPGDKVHEPIETSAARRPVPSSVNPDPEAWDRGQSAALRSVAGSELTDLVRAPAGANAPVRRAPGRIH